MASIAKWSPGVEINVRIVGVVGKAAANLLPAVKLPDWHAVITEV